ncbi:TetR/AcrR family transcriptional regulator [Rhodococcus sp. KBS0724]|uniref:TetR/AcrR family transcriptional regulator n=1 Tax=Rhodococcus sp. KBS0724 TaxID=1179674 RepID=UPI00110E56CD|nr:helix-turn-helix domain-containing protein [Rhodococcus sp. KBS0724]TSD47423.1 TetR/AcrR family transcriptional regulator [Rhodococcus sp. KBS0724]
MPSVDSENVDPKSAMVDVAERLLGTAGVDALSMRDVASVAGQRNTSAVQYHFGGRDQLLIEVFRRRMVAIAQARREFLEVLDAEGRGHDLRALVDASIIPFASSVGTSEDGANYAEFIVRLLPTVDYFSADLDSLGNANREIHQRLVAALAHLPEDVAAERVEMVYNMAFSAIAIYTKRRVLGIGTAVSTFDVYVDHLRVVAVEALSAPQSF